MPRTATHTPAALDHARRWQQRTPHHSTWHTMTVEQVADKLSATARADYDAEQNTPGWYA